ncbi:MAG: DUF1329 domain-containing protein [Telmatospirillum sp.]|nr:DUF1329 domain-containing protein [Telmatospirillum sp.]
MRRPARAANSASFPSDTGLSWPATVFGAALLLLGGTALAADPAALGTRLTAAGADPAAGAEGRIPALEPSSPQLPGWSWGKSRKEFFKYKDDKPLYSVTAENYQSYAALLTPGEIAHLKQDPKFRMDVYPSRRVCGLPDFVADNTKKNVGIARLGADGWSLADAVLPGIPFPMPDNGAQAMWNMKLRYRGVGIDWKKENTSLSPRPGSEEWIRAIEEQTLFFPWGGKGSHRLADLPKYDSMIYFGYFSPSALAGQAIVGSSAFNETGSEAYYYFPGQRRVRRMPTYSYDAPQVGYENTYLVDEAIMFTGPLDRFDWTLAGKKDVIVPYNALDVYDVNGNEAELVQTNGLAPSIRRYEIHRVWVVDATVKEGMRHVSPRRTYYLDEDSWSPLLAEDYDAKGAIWKLREGYLIPVYELGACDVEAFAQYALLDGRFLFDDAVLGRGVDARWYTEPEGPRMRAGFYNAENLRAISDR